MSLLMPYVDFFTDLFTVQVEAVLKYSPPGSWSDAFSLRFRPKLLSDSDSLFVLLLLCSLLGESCFGTSVFKYIWKYLTLLKKISQSEMKVMYSLNIKGLLRLRVLLPVFRVILEASPSPEGSAAAKSEGSYVTEDLQFLLLLPSPTVILCFRSSSVLCVLLPTACLSPSSSPPRFTVMNFLFQCYQSHQAEEIYLIV